MAFFLLQTAIVANDAYVTLNRGRRFVRALFSIWSSQMKKFLAQAKTYIQSSIFSKSFWGEPCIIL